MQHIVGDRWRRLEVEVPALLHVEAKNAIEKMRRGTNLLKHSSSGFPHLRQFQLTDDTERLMWYSSTKHRKDAVVRFSEVVAVELGQTTKTFQKYRLKSLEHLSFSLVYGPSSRTLDLTCKDEFEFDTWVCGCRALMAHHTGRQISKRDLLWHSKRFLKALARNEVGVQLALLPEIREAGAVGLDECVELLTKSKKELEQKLSQLHERFKRVKKDAVRLRDSQDTLGEAAQSNPLADLADLLGDGPAYEAVFADPSDAVDHEMEVRRAQDLSESVEQMLQQARNELLAIDAKGEDKNAIALKHIDQLEWKAEVDIENIEDLCARLNHDGKSIALPIAVAIAEVGVSLQRKQDEVAEQLSELNQQVTRASERAAKDIAKSWDEAWKSATTTVESWQMQYGEWAVSGRK